MPSLIFRFFTCPYYSDISILFSMSIFGHVIPKLTKTLVRWKTCFFGGYPILSITVGHGHRLVSTQSLGKYGDKIHEVIRFAKDWRHIDHWFNMLKTNNFKLIANPSIYLFEIEHSCQTFSPIMFWNQYLMQKNRGCLENFWFQTWQWNNYYPCRGSSY